MTTDELMRIICTEPKFYAGIMRHNTAFMIKKRWKEDRICFSTLIWFFGRFGYELVNDGLDDVLTEIFSRERYFEGVVSESTAKSVKWRWKNGGIDRPKLIEFVGLFGYKMNAVEWQEIKKVA